MTRRELSLACVMLAGATAFVFRTWLFAGQTLYWGDMGLYFYPMMRFLRGELRAGTFPLWNPFIMSGTPFVGNPQVWPLYPGTVLLPFMPASAFLTVSCVLHAFLAGLFFFLFLRRGKLRLTFWPALLGGVAYMFGGYLVGKAQYPNMLQALAFVPLVLWFAERLALRPRLSSALALGTSLGLQLLAAHAQVSAYTLYLALFYGLFCWATASNRPRLRNLLGGSLAAVVVALALSCGQWLPTLAAREYAARQALPLVNVNRLHLAWSDLSNFALPLRYGSPLRGDYSGPGAFWETACYAGTLTLAFALFGLLRGLRVPESRRETLFWLCVFIIGVWLALGLDGGLFRIVYAFVPGMKLFHDPARFLLGASIALSVLAATGLEAALNGLGARGWGTRAAWLGGLAVGLTVLDLSVFVAAVYPLKPVGEIESLGLLSSTALLAAAETAQVDGGRVLTIDDVNADSALVSWTDFGQSDPNGLERLTNTLLPNAAMAAGIRDASGYEPLALRDAGMLSQLGIELTRRQGLAPPPSPVEAAQVAPLLGVMSVRTIVAYRPKELLSTPGFTLLSSRQDGGNTVFVYRNEEFLPRARLSFSWQTVRRATSVDLVGMALRSSADPSFRRPWIEGDVPSSTAAAARPVAARITQDEPDSVRITVPSAPRPRVLVLADTAFPGWQAVLDGKPIPVLKADGAYRAVFLSPAPGSRILNFRYRPEPFVLGFYVMGVAITFLVSYGTCIWRRRQL